MERYFDAVDFATRCHRGQTRKGTLIPYIVHPLSVGKLLARYQAPEEVVVAGILHDTVEDTRATVDDVLSLFGPRVAQLVEGAGEPDKAAAWKERKEHTIKLAQETEDIELLLVMCADKLDNIQDLRSDLEVAGDEMWTRFRAPREEQAWYYRTLAEIFLRRIEQPAWHALAEDFHRQVEALFA